MSNIGLFQVWRLALVGRVSREAFNDISGSGGSLCTVFSHSSGEVMS